MNSMYEWLQDYRKKQTYLIKFVCFVVGIMIGWFGGDFVLQYLKKPPTVNTVWICEDGVVCKNELKDGGF